MKKKRGRKVDRRTRGHTSVMAGRRPRLPNKHRKGLDDFPSPPWAVRTLIEVVLRALGVRRLGVVGEPCCGRMIMAEVLAEYARRVEASDVRDYGYGADVRDYLDRRARSPRTDWVITNPPFRKALPMVLRALREARRGVAIFERIQWLEGGERYARLFAATPPTLIAFFTERVPMVEHRWDPEASSATSYIWMVWVRAPGGGWKRPRPPMWIPPGQRLRLTHGDDIERFAWRRGRRRREDRPI